MTLKYFFSTAIAPVPKEIARHRRKMDELAKDPSFQRVSKANVRHSSEEKKASEKASNAAYDRENTSNPFKKVALWGKEKIYESKATKEWKGQVKTDAQVIKMKNDAGVNPYIKY